VAFPPLAEPNAAAVAVRSILPADPSTCSMEG
jgi:hypothetical protein